MKDRHQFIHIYSYSIYIVDGISPFLYINIIHYRFRISLYSHYLSWNRLQLHGIDQFPYISRILSVDAH
ncbi:MAG: hypothetical protein E7222_03660 [Clostridiales bacterium]|nr:hypothetical protein [Clostridiales bacterium]